MDYRLGCVLRLQDMDEFGGQDYPGYGILIQVIVWNDQKYFVLTVLETILF